MGRTRRCGPFSTSGSVVAGAMTMGVAPLDPNPMMVMPNTIAVAMAVEVAEVMAANQDEYAAKMMMAVLCLCGR
jgi:hypothetical protein